MIVDSSALIAIIQKESDYEELRTKIVTAETLPKMSAANYLEAAIVIDAKYSATASRDFDNLLIDLDIEIIDVTVEQAKIARAAYRDYGKGSGHKAQLNYGDCFAYALASSAREPLLFKGNDFSETDIAPA